MRPRWTNEHLAGLLPDFLSLDDPRGAVEQLHTAYAHGGGWHDFPDFELRNPDHAATIHYPGDPPLRERARTQLRDETIILFGYSWVAVVQPDGAYRIARMD